MRVYLVIVLLLSLHILAGCSGRPEIPKRGPVTNTVSFNGPILSTTINSNCLDVGDTVIITIEVMNPYTTPITLTANPLLDFTLNFPLDETLVRWSETPAYPTIKPVIPPGERHTYTWEWTPSRIYERHTFLIRTYATFQTPKQTTPVALTSREDFGVGIYRQFLCHKLR